MIASLRRPLRAEWLGFTLIAATGAVAGYCLIYASLSGRAESVGDAITWPLLNIVPWILAFEGAKRQTSLPVRALILAVALAGGLALDIGVHGTGDLAFDLVRRMPALFLVTMLLMLVRPAREPTGSDAGGHIELPLAPEQIDWIAAAGNYVEIRSRGRTLICRASLGALERQLVGQGFLRIHRSTLVRGDRIARVRSADVVLLDGTSLKTGNRYRARLGG